MNGMKSSLLLRLLLLLLGFLQIGGQAADAAAAVSDPSNPCHEQLEHLKHRLERKRSNLKEEVENCQEELGLCLATKMAVETRENMCKQRLGVLEDAAAAAAGTTDDHQSELLDLEEKLQVCQQELDQTVTQQEATELRQTIESLSREMSAEKESTQHIVSQLAAANTAQESCAVELQLQSTQLSNLQHQTDQTVAEMLQTVGDLRQELTTERESARKSLESLKEEHQKELASEKEAAQQTIVQLQQALVIQQETAKQTLQSLQEQHQNELAVQNEAAQQTIRQLELDLVTLQSTLNEQKNALWEQATAQAQQQTGRLVERLESQKRALQRWNQQQRQETAARRQTLQAVKDELFYVRRELFDLKERLIRAPELQRRLRQERWREIRDWVRRVWLRGVVARLQPYHEAYVRPVGQSLRAVELRFRSRYEANVRPAWQSLNTRVQAAGRVVRERYDHWCPIVQRNMVLLWNEAAQRATFAWSVAVQRTFLVWREVSLVAKGLRRELSRVGRGLMHRAWQATEGPRLVASQQYEQHVQPHIRTLSQQYQQHVQPHFRTLSHYYQRHFQPRLLALSLHYQQQVQPRMLAVSQQCRHTAHALVEGHHHGRTAATRALWGMTGLLLDYCRIQHYNRCSRISEVLHSRTTEIVYYGEWLLIVLGLQLLVPVLLVRWRRFRRRTRRNRRRPSSFRETSFREKTVVVKTEPSTKKSKVA